MGTQDSRRPNSLQARLDGMHAEEQRLRTFTGWPVAVIDSARIAKAGFFRTGRGAEVECFACGGRISEWNYGDVAMARHRELNPNCPFVRNPTESTNIPIAIPSSSSSSSPVRQDIKENVLSETVHNQDGPDYRKEEVRLASFVRGDGKRWPKQDEVSPSALAKAGFYWNPSNLYGAEEQVSDRVTCAFCESSLGGWESDDDPMSEHRRCSNTCPFVMGAPVGNVSRSSSVQETSVLEGIERHPRCGRRIGGSQFGNEELVELVANSKESGALRNEVILGLHPHRGPINVRYATTESRLASFNDRLRNSWPADRVKHSPLSFAEAGFFYTGHSDRVRCFHCDLGLWEWQDDDDPWIEHARWFQNCEYVRLVKGEDFIIAAKNLRSTNDSPRSTSICTKSSSSSSATTLISEMHSQETSRSLMPTLQANQPTPRVKVRNVTSEELDNLMESAPALMALEVGLDAGRVRNILQRKVEETGFPFSSPDALVLEVLGSQTEERDESEDSEEESAHRWGALGIQRYHREYHSESDSDNEREIDVNDSSEDDAEEGEINTDVIVNFLGGLSHPLEEPQFDSMSTGISGIEPSAVEQGSTGTNNVTAVTLGERACSNPSADLLGSGEKGVSELAGCGTTVAEESSSSIAALEEENRRFRESHLCKVCLDNEVGVVFLPCGHLVSCVHCAPSLKDCPVCRRSIGACVRTYLS